MDALSAQSQHRYSLLPQHLTVLYNKVGMLLLLCWYAIVNKVTGGLGSDGSWKVIEGLFQQDEVTIVIVMATFSVPSAPLAQCAIIVGLSSSHQLL